MDRFHHGDERMRKGLERLVDTLPGLDGDFDFRGMLCQSGDAQGACRPL